MRPVRRIGIFSGVLVLAVLGLVSRSAIRELPDLSAYRHWRVAQTKPVAGTPMTIDDIWWTRSSETHQTFLRVLCHWSHGFPPDDYIVRASLLDSEGALIKGTPTWYVPLPKTRYAPAGVTPFFWELGTTPPVGRNVKLRVTYEPNRLVMTDQGVGPDPIVGYIDFDVPNVAIERNMSCPDIFAPGALWTMNSISGQPN